MSSDSQSTLDSAAAPTRPFEFVDTPEAWAACLERMRAEPRIAMDLEANSLFAYREQICLLQATIADADYIVDPLAGFPLTGLDEVLANPAIEKVFHASEYDLILFQRQWGWSCVNLFDTMWAARVLGFTNMGLAYLLNEFYDVVVSKKYQKTNWALRPLSRPQLAYAQSDTYYLFQLRDDLADRLEEAGLTEEAREIFAREAEVRVPERAFDPEGFWSIRGARDLRPRNRSVLRALYLWREGVAEHRDLPTFKVLGNNPLIGLALKSPRNRAEMAQVHGIQQRFIDRYGVEILRLVEEALRAAPPRPPAPKPRQDPEVVERFERLQQWRKACAVKRGVESDVILTRDALWTLARTPPQTHEELAALDVFGPTGLARYGKALLRELE